MLQAPEAILVGSVSGLEAKARENWHCFTWSSPWSLCPGFPLFHSGSFSCKKQTPSSCLQNSGVLLGQPWTVIRSGKLSRPAAALGTSVSYSLSLSHPLSCSLQLFVQFCFLSAGWFPLTLYLFCSRRILVSSWFEGVFSSSAPVPSPFSALQFSVPQSHLIGQIYLCTPGHTGHKSLPCFGPIILGSCSPRVAQLAGRRRRLLKTWGNIG